MIFRVPREWIQVLSQCAGEYHRVLEYVNSNIYLKYYMNNIRCQTNTVDFPKYTENGSRFCLSVPENYHRWNIQTTRYTVSQTFSWTIHQISRRFIWLIDSTSVHREWISVCQRILQGLGTAQDMLHRLLYTDKNIQLTISVHRKWIQVCASFLKKILHVLKQQNKNGRQHQRRILVIKHILYTYTKTSICTAVIVSWQFMNCTLQLDF